MLCDQTPEVGHELRRKTEAPLPRGQEGGYSRVGLGQVPWSSYRIGLPRE